MKKSILSEWKEGMPENQEDELLQHALRQKFDGELRNRWKGMLADAPRGSAVEVQPKLSVRFLVWAIAASLILALSAGIWMMNRPQTIPGHQMASQMLDKIANQSTDIYKGPNQVSLSWQAAQIHFSNQEYDKAANELERMSEEKALNTSQLFFLSLCYLKTFPPNYNRALEKLQLAREQNTMIGTTDFSEEIDWVISLTYILKGDSAEARKALEQISHSDGWFKTSAEQMLKDM